MQITTLFKKFDELQKIYGDTTLDAVYGCGEVNKPKVCLVFMNPTARNVSAHKQWKGLKAPWIGTKNVWQMFYQLGLLEESIYNKIIEKHASEWNNTFAKDVYKKIVESSLYITNLSKATQLDARPLSNQVFQKYMDLFLKEMSIVQPHVIITFGNQVSSVLLQKNIRVGEYRKKHEVLNIAGSEYKVFPVYYPVGQGMRNIKTAKEDIDWILKNFK